MTQAQKAQVFNKLHQPGTPVVLYNIWDAGSARVVADAGATALATGSWSVAAAHGYPDGQAIPLDLALRVVERIAASVDLPLTVDFEGGYATDPETLTQNIRQLIATGAIGLNFEDQIVGGTGLHPIDQQVARIKAIRQAATDAGIALFINARTDLFLKSKPEEHASLLADAQTREQAYAQAGADGFFTPGLSNTALIKTLCAKASLPVNVMKIGALLDTPVADLAALGVARISFGPGPYRLALVDLANAYKAALG